MKKKYVRGTTLEEHKADLMKNPKFRKAWEELQPEFDLMEKMIIMEKKAWRKRDTSHIYKSYFLKTWEVSLFTYWNLKT